VDVQISSFIRFAHFSSCLGQMSTGAIALGRILRKPAALCDWKTKGRLLSRSQSLSRSSRTPGAIEPWLPGAKRVMDVAIAELSCHNLCNIEEEVFNE
jgi:hypothetical protein